MATLEFIRVQQQHWRELTVFRVEPWWIRLEWKYGAGRGRWQSGRLQCPIHCWVQITQQEQCQSLLSLRGCVHLTLSGSRLRKWSWNGGISFLKGDPFLLEGSGGACWYESVSWIPPLTSLPPNTRELKGYCCTDADKLVVSYSSPIHKVYLTWPTSLYSRARGTSPDWVKACHQDCRVPGCSWT